MQFVQQLVDQILGRSTICLWPTSQHTHPENHSTDGSSHRLCSTLRKQAACMSSPPCRLSRQDYASAGAYTLDSQAYHCANVGVVCEAEV